MELVNEAKKNLALLNSKDSTLHSLNLKLNEMRKKYETVMAVNDKSTMETDIQDIESKIKVTLADRNKAIQDVSDNLEVVKSHISDIVPKDSSLFFFDLTSLNLSLLGLFSLSLLILNQVIFSCIISIIFIFYGDYLVNKFKIENRYPRLYKLISLRRKFQAYYLLYNIGMIITVLLIEAAGFIYLIYTQM